MESEVESVNLSARRIANNKPAPAPPILIGKLQEDHGDLRIVKKGPPPVYWIDLWIEGAPAATQKVVFEILDSSFTDNPWTVKRQSKSTRDFLTNDMSSYGDVAILARGLDQEKAALWTIEGTLLQALLGYYRGREKREIIESALEQIRDN